MHTKESPHEAGCKNTHKEQAYCNAIRRLKNLLPTLALESRIALECARDLCVTGGIEIEDGKRLATAYERLKRIAEVVAAAELEVRR